MKNALQIAIENAREYLLVRGWRYQAETGDWIHTHHGKFASMWRAMAAEEGE
jgi:hypothetical protein